MKTMNKNKNNQRPASSPSAKTLRKRAKKAALKQAVDSSGFKFGFDKFKLGPIEIGGGYAGTSSNYREAGMVGLGTRAVNIQRRMPRLLTTVDENGNTVDRITGTDLLGTINSSVGGNVAGDRLFAQNVSPSEFPLSRLAQFAALYQRYRFRRVTFVYDPIANATESGQLCLFPDFDIDNKIVTNQPSNLQVAAAHQNEQITQIWQKCAVDFAQTRNFTDLFTEENPSEDGEERLSVQGVFYVIAASVLGSDIALGNIYVDYEVDFSIPFLSITAATSSVRSGGTQAYSLTQSSSGGALILSDVEEIDQFGPVTLNSDDDGNLFLQGVPQTAIGGTFGVTAIFSGGDSTEEGARAGSVTFTPVNLPNANANSASYVSSGSFFIAGFDFSATVSALTATLGMQITTSTLPPGVNQLFLTYSFHAPQAPVQTRGTRAQKRVAAMEKELKHLRLLAKEVSAIRSDLKGLASQQMERHRVPDTPVINRLHRDHLGECGRDASISSVSFTDSNADRGVLRNAAFGIPQRDFGPRASAA